jgi:eukaryotic-like serine/threonine-protein kinase
LIGQTISHYKILEKLGEGGMGIVYKAQDNKLDRRVALKFLPPNVAASEQDKARFIQEAKAASALNHPNVCTIHDIQEHDGQMFIVMEFVDGQTLRERKSSVSFKQAMDIGIQIADGLAAAHEKGIVHRDIKPENIMIRKDGIAQIMDFGLAKLRGAAGVSRLTKEGSTVGTAGYMSPEQVQGQDADHRSDIFSLGVLLYELFTGQLPFKGVHETALAYEIVNVDAAPMSSIKPDIDPNLDAVVLECLAKEPDERTQSAKQVSVDLKRYRRESGRSRASRIAAAPPLHRPSQVSGEQVPATLEPTKKTRMLPWIAASVFLLGMIVLGFLYFRETTKELSVFRFTLAPPENAVFAGQIPIISPDGQRVAFVVRDSSGVSLIWVRPLSSLIATPLTGTVEAMHPFWSPDSRFLGFFQNGKLKKIEATGGPTQTICDAPQGRGGTWGSVGIIVFTPSFNSGLLQVSQTGGTPTELTRLDTARRENSHRWPSFLPDGRHFIYLSQSSPEENNAIFLASLDSKDKTLLLHVNSNAIFAPPGYLLFAKERSLMAQPFNANKGELNGEAFPIAEDVGFEQSRNFSLFSASTNGVLTFGMGVGVLGNRQLVWCDRSGKRLDKVGAPGFLFDFSLSPDEKRIAFRRVDRQTRSEDLWMLDLLRGTESRFTFRPARDDDPVWSPDGSKILFDSNPDGVSNLHQKIASGAGSEELLLKSTSADYPLDWSADGRYILFGRDDPKTKTDLWILPLTGDRKPFPYMNSEAVEYSGRFSPDGRWIAYSSDESGKFEVYIQAFPLTSGRWQVSVGGGAAPIWSKDGKEMFYLASDKKLMSVDVKTGGGSIEQGVPKPLFSTDVDNYTLPNRYAISRDGKRFLVNNGIESTSTKPIAVVVNWTADARTK